MADAAAETTPEPVVEPSAVVDPLPSSSSSTTEPVASPEPPVEASAKKKGGRPTGAKDAKPRTRRPPVVRIEPIPQQQQQESPPPRPVQEKRVVAATVTQIPEPELEVTPPPSPRTLYREMSRNLMALRGVMHDNRRSTMEATVSQKLASWPLV